MKAENEKRNSAYLVIVKAEKLINDSARNGNRQLNKINGENYFRRRNGENGEI
jgi:hypothetical protein